MFPPERKYKLEPDLTWNAQNSKRQVNWTTLSLVNIIRCTMHAQPEHVHHLRRSLIIACLSLVAIFLVKLYYVRVHFIKLKKNGLVRSSLISWTNNPNTIE
jgi:hypothetical protein